MLMAMRLLNCAKWIFGWAWYLERRFPSTATNHVHGTNTTLRGGGVGLENKCCVSYAISITIFSVAKKLLIREHTVLISSAL